MARPTLVSRRFDLGFQSDIPRDQLPLGAAYRMVDYIPQNDSPLRKRGGWTRASRDLNAVSALTRVEALAWAPFSAEAHLVAISDNGKLYKIRQFDGANVAAAGSNISTAEAQGPVCPPFFHGGPTQLVIIPDSLTFSRGGTTTATRKYDGTTAANLGGSPPRFTCGCSWGDYVIGANGFIGATRYANRAWWSDPALPETWNPATSYWDFPEEILAVVPRNKQLMFFGNTGVHFLLGDTPPPGGNFEMRRYFFTQGTFDVRSIVTYGDYVIWANNTGVWRSDGANLVDMTKQGGISNFWRALVAGYTTFTTPWTVSAGIYRGFLFITVINTTTVQTTLVCDITRNVWFQMSNVGAFSYAQRISAPGSTVAGGFEEMFGAVMSGTNARQVNNFSPLWSPASTNASDADGVAITPVLETPFYKMGTDGFKRYRRAFISYDMTSAAGSPVMNTSYIDSPEDISYVSLASLPEKAAVGRAASPLTINKKREGIGLKFAQSAASDDTRIHAIEIDGHALEGSR